MEKRTLSGVLFDLVNYVVLAGLMVLTIYPILYVFLASVSEPSEMLSHSGLLWKPLGFTLLAYKKVFENPMILTGYINTVTYVVIGLGINLLLTSLGAYGLSRPQIKYRKQITLFIIFTMFFSGGLIPFYLVVKGIGLNNTLWALVLPNAISTFNLMIMRTSFEAIPASLEESARMDGANDLVILFRIILPLSLPVLAVMTLYYGVSHWNSWFNAMIFLKDRSQYPLQLILREILIQNDTSAMSSGLDIGQSSIVGETIKYATIIVATVPILLVYPLLQKYFAKGALVGAVKG
ncbi:carbohydrate ABC transporter permease [Paenibacillus planticolens]|uniref:ABC transporter permease subunit n=1 Tax=Paenibacillus planticolens TaxID=2654976 RepID=A0ABX2A071_9BACL|nr:carbohydrate ABC transporter permease [Paenibacillus planticolens]NOV04730.1 ABC transporter permease subunit [Paenibacillus planticolens]